jgi:hypothetical protein
MNRAVLLGVAAAIAACEPSASAPQSPTTSATAASATPSASSPATRAPATAPTATNASTADPSRPIGSATMEADGTLVLNLYAETPDGRSRGMAQIRKKPGDAEYDKWLKHLGGMKPGEEKLVPPWP